MKTVHIVGAGGVAGIGLSRCLKEHYDLTGHDNSEWAELVMEVPYAEPRTADMIIPVPDAAVRSRYGDSDLSFTPSKEQLEIAKDKARTAKLLGDLAPLTYWVRDTEGAGGKGAQMASEVLPGRNFSQEFVFYEGKLLAGFQKERISYAVKGKTIGTENVGSSAVSVCRLDQKVLDVALEAVQKLALASFSKPHGFYGVDLKESDKGEFKVTEINAGRLLTASYTYFYLTGYNLPLMGARAFLKEELPILPDYPEGYGVIRQTDCLPRLIPPETTKLWL